MAETTNRVVVTMTFVTGQEPSHVLRSVLDLIPDDLVLGELESIQAHSFDLADPDGPEVQLVVGAAGGLLGAYVDGPERAEAHAKGSGAVVVSVPVDVDYRREVDR